MTDRERLKEAKAAIESAQLLAAKSQDRGVRLAVSLTEARILTALGQFETAAQKIEAVLGEARKVGFTLTEMEATLALGELEIRSGKATAGRARLAALQKQAEAKGIRLLAQKAAALRGA